MPARDKFVDEIRADETGCAGDKTFHKADNPDYFNPDHGGISIKLFAGHGQGQMT
jgi:hypothetical protein